MTLRWFVDVNEQPWNPPNWVESTDPPKDVVRAREDDNLSKEGQAEDHDGRIWRWEWQP